METVIIAALVAIGASFIVRRIKGRVATVDPWTGSCCGGGDQAVPRLRAKAHGERGDVAP